MTVELNVWNKETSKYDIKEVIEQEFVTLDFYRQYEVHSIYTHPFSPEVRIFADPVVKE